jgi:protein O-mannosyl-transferase
MNFDWKSRLPLLIGFMLLLATLALYWPVLHCEFINYDDHPYVVGNSHVHAGLTLQGCRWAFGIGYACNWHPVTWLSHMADCQIFGLDPRGHHLTNLLLHLANTLLLLKVLRRMTGALWPSALVAALFAWHPLHVESVAWVAERKDLLSTWFFLLTLWAYGSYVEQSKVQSSKSKVRYTLAIFLFALGLMSKPMLVTLPFVLLLLDYWPLRRLELEVPGAICRKLCSLLLEKTPFFALSLISCVITLIAQKRGGAVVPLQVIAFDSRCWNALVSWLRYVMKLFWPQDLSVIYPYVLQWPLSLIGLAAAFLVAVTLLALKCRRRAPYFPVGWFWYLGTLVPVIGLVQVGEQAMADRYTYIPSIGVFMIISWAILRMTARWPRWRPALAGGVLLALAACGWTTRLQVRHWRDGVTLFEHALAVTENNAVAHATLGLALMDKGKLAEAVVQYEAALRISPEYSLAHNDLGVALARLGRLDQAIAHYQTALQINPKDAEAHFNLANALNPGFVDTYAVSGAARNHRADAPQAREHYQTALRLYPHYVNAHINWGNLELTVGELEAAITHYQDALRVDPLAALAHFNLGNALAKMGKTKEALGAYTKAVSIEPGDSLARFRLANLLVSRGDFEEAIPHYRQVVKLDPRHFAAWGNLGSALAQLGEYQEALQCFTEASRIQPDYLDAHVNLAKLLAEQGDLEAALKECFECLRLEPDNPELHRQAALWLGQQGKLQDAVDHFSVVARLTPAAPGAHYDLGLALFKCGESKRALDHFREALRLKQNYVLAMNNLAWVLATHESKEVRNGAEAVSLATRACVLTTYKEPRVTGTLAVAYAETGQFDKAIEMGERTRELALASSDKHLADEAMARLELFRAGKPYHETSVVKPH